MAFNLIKNIPNMDGFRDGMEIIAISHDKNQLKKYAKKELGIVVKPLEFFTLEPYYSIAECNTIILEDLKEESNDENNDNLPPQE